MGIYERKLLAKARPMMAEDEQVEVVFLARIATNVAIGIATGGAGFAIGLQAEAYLILTDRQLLMFQSDQGMPGKHLTTVPRQYAHPVDVRDGTLFTKFFLHVDGWQNMLKLTVPPLPPRWRKRGRLFIKSLGG
jgi:hypothetical protein